MCKDHLIVCTHNVDTLNICMAIFDTSICWVLFLQNDSIFELAFLLRFCVFIWVFSVQIVHEQGTKLVPSSFYCCHLIFRLLNDDTLNKCIKKFNVLKLSSLFACSFLNLAFLFLIFASPYGSFVIATITL